jgi:haloalkane dehalogenase
MDVYRTPDARFEGLSEFPFQPHYVNVDGLRMHYLDEGERGAAPVLMLHGEPTWSYLYRRMIGGCARAGHRVIAPDLIGFGKSDKPTARADYINPRHVDGIKAWVRALELGRIKQVCQDWGALIGLRVAAEEQERFDRIIVGNGALPAPGAAKGALTLPNALAFLSWRLFATYSPWFPISAIVNAGCRRTLSAEERRAYDAPFPEEEACAGARAFPRLVPISARDPAVEANRAAWDVLRTWQKPFLTVFSDGDPITRGLERTFQTRVPGARAQPHSTPHAGHFLQEDAGPELAETINRFIAADA